MKVAHNSKLPDHVKDVEEVFVDDDYILVIYLKTLEDLSNERDFVDVLKTSNTELLHSILIFDESSPFERNLFEYSGGRFIVGHLGGFHHHPFIK